MTIVFSRKSISFQFRFKMTLVMIVWTVKEAVNELIGLSSLIQTET